MSSPSRTIGPRLDRFGLPAPKWRGRMHLIAAPLAAIAGLVLVLRTQSSVGRVAAAIFTIAAVNLFGVSAAYHLGRWGSRAKTALRRLDHANIFVIIAATYTPPAIVLLPKQSAVVLLSGIWLAAVGGVLISTIWINAPRILTVAIYLGMGWASVAYIPQFLAARGWWFIALIALGGLFYTIGAVVYGLKRPRLSVQVFGFHELFHAFTVAAFIAHFTAVALAVASA